MNDLPKDIVETLLANVRRKPEYIKLMNNRAQYLNKRMYVKAASVEKAMKDIELMSIKLYFENMQKEQDRVNKLFASMKEEDSDMLSAYTFAIGMCSDVIESMIMEIDSIYKKYNAPPITAHFKAMRALCSEAKTQVRYFDGSLTTDDFYASSFGDACDNLLELAVNKSKGFIRRVRKHNEKNANKEASRNSKVA